MGESRTEREGGSSANERWLLTARRGNPPHPEHREGEPALIAAAGCPTDGALSLSGLSFYGRIAPGLVAVSYLSVVAETQHLARLWINEMKSSA